MENKIYILLYDESFLEATLGVFTDINKAFEKALDMINKGKKYIYLVIQEWIIDGNLIQEYEFLRRNKDGDLIREYEFLRNKRTNEYVLINADTGEKYEIT